MNCPDCGKEIKENIKFCPSCGTKIDIVNESQPTNKVADFIKNFIKTKPFKISLIISSIVLAFALSAFAFLNISSKEVSTYKSITLIEKSQMDGMSVRSALDLLIQQDKDLAEYTNKPFSGKIDKLFETFYGNLIAFTVCHNLKYSGFGEQNQAKNGIEFKFNKVKDEYSEYVESLELIKPQTSLFTMFHVQDANFEAGINHKYLIDKYSKSLSPSWQEYLKLRQTLDHDLDVWHSGSAGWVPSQMAVVDFYLAGSKFLKDYPDFPIKTINQKLLDTFISTMTKPDFYQGFFETEESSYNKLAKLPDDIKKAYEKFLSEADKNTKEYEMISKLYDGMKKYNFNYSFELNKIAYDITGEKDYLETYNREKEEAQKQQAEQKIIQDYNNLKYDKAKLHKLYKEASASWEIHQLDQDENGYYIYGNGGAEGYMTNYITEQAPEFKKVLETFWDYCSLKTDEEGMAGFRNCYIDAIKK